MVLTPFVIFVLYVFKLRNGTRAIVWLPIVFGLLILPNLLALGMVIFPRLYWMQFWEYTRFFYHGFYLQLGLVLAGILAVIGMFNGFSKKILTIAIVICMACETLFFIEHIVPDLQRYALLYFTYQQTFAILGMIVVWSALLLLVLKNRILFYSRKHVEKASPEKAIKYLNESLSLGLITEEEYQVQFAITKKRANAINLPSEQALLRLKDYLAVGLITEEEYQAQRTEIISKL